jgi:RecA/RadA recombinase
MAGKKKAAKKKKAASRKTKKTKEKAEGAVALPPPIETGKLTGSALRTQLRAYKTYVNDGAGRQIVGFASEAHSTSLLRRPCFITDIDIATGGGLPAGGPVQIAGPEASGKTYLAMLYMLVHQILYGEASSLLYVCTETAGFDFKRAAKMGLKVGLPLGYVPEIQDIRAQRGQALLTEAEIYALMQKVGELMIVQTHTGEEALDAVLHGVQQKLFGIIVVDSLSNILPEANADKELDEENKRAAHATLMTNFVKQYTPLINHFGDPNFTTLIGIAQARSNAKKAQAGAKGRNMRDWDVPIAWAWKHAVLQNILIWNGQRMEKQHHKVKSIIGKEVHWAISKGKAGAHEHVNGGYNFFFDDVFPDLELPYGADTHETLMIAGMRHGIIREHKGKIFLVRAANGEPFMSDIPGLPALKNMVSIDLDLALALRQEVMSAKGIECRYQ